MAPNKRTNRHQTNGSLSVPARVTRSSSSKGQKEDLTKLVHNLQAASEDPKTAEKIAIAKDQIKKPGEDAQKLGEDVQKLGEDTQMGGVNQPTGLPDHDAPKPIKQEDGQPYASSTSPKSSVGESASDSPSPSSTYGTTSTSGTRATSEDVLFVADEAEGLSYYEDDEDVFTLEDARREIDGDSDEEDGEPEGWMKRGSGKSILLSYGPRNAAKYRIKPQSEVTTTITSDDSKNLTWKRLGDSKINGEKVYQKGSVAAIQAVAWEYPTNDKNPILSLCPANRRLDRNKRPHFGLTLIKVRLFVPRAEGKKQEFVTSWETRSSFGDLFGNRKVTLKKSIELDGIVLVSNDEIIGRADAAIIKAAIRCERRHKEYLARIRPATDKSPTPDSDPEFERLRDMSPTPDPPAASRKA